MFLYKGCSSSALTNICLILFLKRLCCPVSNSLWETRFSPTFTPSWKPSWSPPAEDSLKWGTSSSVSWWRSARTQWTIAAVRKWERWGRTLINNVSRAFLKRWLTQNPLFVAYGQDFHVGLPSGEDAELLWEDGGVGPWRPPAEMWRVQSLCVHPESSDPHETGDFPHFFIFHLNS